MRVTDKGQVTIPKQLRDAFGIDAGSEVVFEQVSDGILVRKATGTAGRGRGLVRRLRGRGDVMLTTDEIMSMTRGDQT